MRLREELARLNSQQSVNSIYEEFQKLKEDNERLRRETINLLKNGRYWVKSTKSFPFYWYVIVFLFNEFSVFESTNQSTIQINLLVSRIWIYFSAIDSFHTNDDANNHKLSNKESSKIYY